jgi:hypothetical protein
LRFLKAVLWKSIEEKYAMEVNYIQTFKNANGGSNGLALSPHTNESFWTWDDPFLWWDARLRFLICFATQIFWNLNRAACVKWVVGTACVSCLILRKKCSVNKREKNTLPTPMSVIGNYWLHWGFSRLSASMVCPSRSLDQNKDFKKSYKIILREKKISTYNFVINILRNKCSRLAMCFLNEEVLERMKRVISENQIRVGHYYNKHIHKPWRARRVEEIDLQLPPLRMYPLGHWMFNALLVIFIFWPAVPLNITTVTKIRHKTHFISNSITNYDVRALCVAWRRSVVQCGGGHISQFQFTITSCF